MSRPAWIATVLFFSLLMHAVLAPGLASAVPDGSSASPFAYHVRLVHVAGAGTRPGAAVGWAADSGKPVMLPEYETWGTPEQLDALAEALGAERAEAVTGFFITADMQGVNDFRRPVYVGSSALGLELRATPPLAPDDAHQVELILQSPEPTAPPLTEAELLLRTDRTVAIACPAVAEGDWLVVAVTLIDQQSVSRQSETMGKLHDSEAPGIEKPRVVKKVEPYYPEAARKNGVSGHVELEVILDREGVPHAPTVVSMSPGCEELAASAVESVLQWRFEPARFEGAPAAVLFRVSVSFKLH